MKVKDRKEGGWERVRKRGRNRRIKERKKETKKRRKIRRGHARHKVKGEPKITKAN